MKWIDVVMKMVSILQDLLDDQNMILYALIALAFFYQDQAPIIVGALVGYWKGKKDGVK